MGEAEEAGNIKKIHSVPKSFSFSLLKMFHGFSFFNLSFQTDLRQMDSENKKTESLSCHFYRHSALCGRLRAEGPGGEDPGHLQQH